MTTNLHISVLGRPSPQGSKKHVGGGRMIEASKYLPAWRKAVCTAAVKAVQDELWAKPAGPVELAVTFYLERPTTIKPDKRPMPIKPPDLDKLVRGVCDALSDAGVWEDDAQVVKLTAFKEYADTREPGCAIEVTIL